MSRFSDTVRDELERAIPGVLVYVYDWDVPSQTTGALSSLTDDDLTTALPNPMTTDEFGQFYFNATTGVKLIEYHYGGKLLERDQIILTPAGFYPGNDATIRADLAANGGDALVSVRRSEAGAVARTLQAKIRDTVSVKDFGATGNGTTDDTAAIQSALSTAASAGASLSIPSGTYKVTAGLAVSLSGTGKSIKLIGDGSGASIIALANSGAAKTLLTITLGDWTNTFAFRDIGFTTNTANQDTAIAVTCTTAASSPSITDPSLFDNCTFMGSDGPVTTKYFANYIVLTKVSAVNFSHCCVLGYDAGAGNFASNAVGVKILGTATPVFGVVYSFVACDFINVGTGIYYGTYIQGVSVSASNFTGCSTGISIPDNTGTGQLTVVGTQFDCGSYGIHDAGEWGIELGSCFFNIKQPSTGLNNYGFYTANPNGVTISGSYFARQSTGAGTSYGIYVTGTGTIGSSFTGNTFDSLDYGQYWAADTAKLICAANSYTSCTHLCWNLGASGMSTNNDALYRSTTAISLGASLGAGATTTVSVSLPSGMFASKPEKVFATIGDGTVPLLVWYSLTASSISTAVLQVYNPTGSSVGTGPYRFNVQAAQ